MDKATAQALFNRLPDTLAGISAEGLGELIAFNLPVMETLEIFLAGTCHGVEPNISVEAFREQIRPEIQAALKLYPDFALYSEAMVIVGLGFLPVATRITAREYVLSLYLLAKHADFMSDARNRAILAAYQSKGEIQ